MSKRIFQTFLADKCRIGVAEAAEVILERISRGLQTTTIVLPPRYGKSNLMRSVSIEAMHIGLVGAVVCLVPWVFLAEQLNYRNSVKQMERLHGMDQAPARPRASDYDILSGKINPRFYEDQPQRAWWTMTMAQACQESTRLILKSAATHFKDDEHRPLLVWIDECHLTSSGEDGWGEIARELSLAGAHLVLLTGTPERSDNVAPFGFKTIELDREDEEKWRRAAVQPEEDGLVALEKISQQKVRNKLIADYKVSLKQAWSADILAGLFARYFTFKSDGEDVHDQSITEGRRSLAAAVRKPEVIAQAVDLMLDEMKNRRANAEGRDTAAIVFVGSDRYTDNSIANDEKKDYECRQVKRIIEERWKRFFGTSADVKIATLGDDNGVKARKTIVRFVGDDIIPGEGDVIIVKQMGGVGLDAPRLKIGVDLSTTRSLSNTIQRWLRIATKYGKVRYGTMILPGDANTMALWEAIVREEGGQTSYDNLSVIDTKIVGTTEGDESPELTISEPARYGAIDTELRYVDVDEDLNVDAIFESDPSLAILLTRSKVADMIAKGLLKVPEKMVSPPSTMRDINQIIQDRLSTIHKYSKQLASRAAPYSESDTTNDWVTALKQIMIQAKNFAGIAGELKTCRDINKLEAMIHHLERKVQSS